MKFIPTLLLSGVALASLDNCHTYDFTDKDAVSEYLSQRLWVAAGPTKTHENGQFVISGPTVAIMMPCSDKEGWDKPSDYFLIDGSIDGSPTTAFPIARYTTDGTSACPTVYRPGATGVEEENYLKPTALYRVEVDHPDYDKARGMIWSGEDVTLRVNRIYGCAYETSTTETESPTETETDPEETNPEETDPEETETEETETEETETEETETEETDPEETETEETETEETDPEETESTETEPTETEPTEADTEDTGSENETSGEEPSDSDTSAQASDDEDSEESQTGEETDSATRDEASSPANDDSQTPVPDFDDEDDLVDGSATRPSLLFAVTAVLALFL